MKKFTCLLVITFFLLLAARSQDLGYKTTDVGGEFKWQPDGMLLNLQLAFNAKTYHSFIFRTGYNKIKSGSPAHNNENGNGWGGSVGYRYHFSVIPRRFFIGPKIDIWKMTFHWSTPLLEGDSKFVILQPSIETGFTFLINDLFFITPHLVAGYQIKTNKKGETIAYGEGFIPQVGISAGWRF